ncbi:hypothetical protein VTL71DRAFT_9952 [Oculimacula yallundae]|uniref:Uncharacterized protein n=1 Tax=Oculimacula yallundae TaxID=86028 RepID=A0ABR4BR25_9HELO
MKLFSVIAAVVASSLVGQTLAAPVAGDVVARTVEDRGLATMFYGCLFTEEEVTVDDADPDATRTKKRCIPKK